MNYRLHIATLLLFLGVVPLKAQHYNVPLNRESHLYLESLINASEAPHHTGIRPYIHSRLIKNELANYNQDTLKYYYLISDLMFRRHAVEVNKEDFSFSMDPLFNFEWGKDVANSNEFDRMRFKNTRAFMAEGSIGDKISFHTRFFENQVTLTRYMNDFVDTYGVMPGGGRVKPFKDTIGWDYSASYGYVAFAPNDNWNIQFGNEKNFIGEGYRSMLLSDNAFYYPSLKVSGLFGDSSKFQYTTMITVLQTLERMPNNTTPEGLLMKKGGTFHYLSYNATKKLQLGLFEGTVFERVDSNDSTRAFNFGYYIPVLGANTLIQGLSGTNNVVLGLNLKYRATPTTQLYGQVAVDNLSEGRYGWQAGTKMFDLFGAKRLTLQLEYNGATPYTYANDVPRQNYAHMNQALAHPLGAGFNEFVGILNFEKKRFFTQAKVNLASYAEDYGVFNYGQNIFQSTNEQDVLGKTNTNLSIIDLQIGYLMNRHTKMRMLFGAFIRNTENAAESHETVHLYVAFRTNLSNFYYDF